MAEDTQDASGRNGPVGEPEPALRGGGFPLPGLKYRWGEPEDLVGAAVFLSSEASQFVTGVALPVDGGYSVADRLLPE
jgi:NAD(P)-dependent dehydrogenase (short-subunit alcohol dehydrogenase family)